MWYLPLPQSLEFSKVTAKLCKESTWYPVGLGNKSASSPKLEQINGNRVVKLLDEEQKY
jgi:hypothetical protein